MFNLILIHSNTSVFSSSPESLRKRKDCRQADITKLYIFIIALSGFFLLLGGTITVSDAFKLPDSGQTQCYDGAGNIITCPPPGDPMAQDGSYNINPLSYNDDGNYAVKDNNTGLIWEKSEDQGGNWYRANGTYHETYNMLSQSVCGSSTRGGYSDWRLPSKKELITIVDYSKYPALNTEHFLSTIGPEFWSSASWAYDPSLAWFVDFYYGAVSLRDKRYGASVRCVRGNNPVQSFIDNGNGTVTDAKNGLIWQKGEPGDMTWSSALSYCEALSLGGYTDWRLPNIKELESITDDARSSPTINTVFFPNTYAYYYWSSTSCNSYPFSAWAVPFHDGYALGARGKGNYQYVRCARGGYSIFSDMSSNHWAYNYVYAIYNAGITTGCTQDPLNYCPDKKVTRAAMAAFIIRAKYGENFTYNPTPYFTDVPPSNQFFKYIQKMRDDGITTGCTATEYCPQNNVTRAAMAAFIIRAKYAEDFAYSSVPYFTDVPSSNLFFKYIQKMKYEGITTGYVYNTYEPMLNVTRAAMAAFLSRAFLGMQ